MSEQNNSAGAKAKAVGGRLTAMRSLELATRDLTAPGLVNAATSERLHVRCLWLLVFAACLSVFFFHLSLLGGRLTSREVSSTYEAESVDFEAPDMYFCLEQPISGSYFLNLTESQADLVNELLIRTLNRFVHLVKAASLNEEERERVFKENSAEVAVSSLPFWLLTDLLGHRAEQTFISARLIDPANGVQDLTMQPFPHPEHVTCFRADLTPANRGRMRSLEVYADFELLLDRFHDWMPRGNYPVLSLLHWWPSDQPPVPLRPSDWTLTNLLPLDRAAGIRLYLPGAGEYPSGRFASSFLLQPGQLYDLRLTMRDTVRAADREVAACLETPPRFGEVGAAVFVNPRDGSPQKFNYSMAACYFADLTRQALQQLNCSREPFPLPWHRRGSRLRRCLNLTGVDDSEAMQAIESQWNRSFQLDDQSDACTASRLCRSRSYSVQLSAASWPAAETATRYVRQTIGGVRLRRSGSHLPAWDFLIDLCNRHDVETVQSNESNEFRAHIAASLVRVRIRSAESRSTQLTLGRGYTWAAFWADTGGILGLYLGWSVLTLFEILQFVHDLFVAVVRNNRDVAPEVKQAQQGETQFGLAG